MVLVIRAWSSGKVVSVSAKLGASPPVRRAAAPLAESEAIWTWRLRGCMSGARRAPISTAGSIFRASAEAAPFSRMAERLRRVRIITGTQASYIEIGMCVLGAFDRWQEKGFAPRVRRRRRTKAQFRLQARGVWRGSDPRRDPFHHHRLPKDRPMKTFAVMLALAVLAGAGPAAARGCLKGAVVGGVAGHFAHHHALAGAAVGCAVGHHLAHKHDLERRRALAAGHH